MKKAILLCGMLLAVSATVASAAGVNMRWTRCFGEGTGTLNKTFACTSNTGSNLLVSSFIMDTDLPQVSGLEFVIDLASQSANLDQWWQFKNAGTCRSTALNCNGTPNGADVVCQDWGAGVETTALAAYAVGSAIPGDAFATPNRARIIAVSAVPPSALVDLTGGTEYFAFNTTISNVKTVGTGACGGCADPVCLVLSSIKVATPCGAACDRKLSGPSNGTDSNFCEWQGGGSPASNKGIGCPGATPNKSKTWGEVKSLYRN